MEGRHVHPSTLYPGGVGTVATMQLFTDYLTRLMRYVEFMKRVVPLHDDLFDFFYEALPGYEHVGERRVLLGCWGSLNDPAHCDFTYENMTDWGRKMFVTPGVSWSTASSSPTTWSTSTSASASCSAAPTTRTGRTEPRCSSTRDPLGQPGRPQAPVEPAHDPAAAEARLRRQVQLGRCRRAGSTARTTSPPTPAAARSPGCGRRRSAGWSTSAYVKATGHSVQINLPRTVHQARGHASSGRSRRQWSQRDRAQPGPHLLPGLRGRAARCTSCEKALAEVRAGRTKTWEPFTVPGRGDQLRVHRGGARRAVSHHMVIRDGKIANYHPYPPTPWNGSVRDVYGTPGPYEDAVQNTPIFEENPPENFKGIDIMRAVRSFDPCLPCGVHMYLGNGGKALEQGRTRRSSAVNAGHLSRRRADATTGVRAGRRADRGAARRAAAAAAAPGRRASRRGTGRAARRAVRRRPRRTSWPRSPSAGRPVRAAGRAGRGPAGREPAAAARPAPARRRRADPARAGPGAALPRLARRRRRVPRRHDDGVARLRLEGSCDGCPSSTVTVQLAIEGAVLDAAPEVTEVVVEGMTDRRREPALLQIGRRPAETRRRAAEPDARRAGSRCPTSGRPARGRSSRRPGGVPCCVCAVRGTLYAYRDACAGVRLVDGRRAARPRGADLPGLRRALRRAAGRAGASTTRPCTSIRCRCSPTARASGWPCRQAASAVTGRDRPAPVRSRRAAAGCSAGPAAPDPARTRPPRCWTASAPAQARGRRPTRRARCARPRSPPSTATWPTWSRPALLCTCRACYLLFTQPRARRAAGTAPCRTATCATRPTR